MPCGVGQTSLALFHPLVTDLRRACVHEVFDFRVCVAAVGRLPAFHYSVDFNFLSFGIMGFIVELRNY